MYNIFKKGKVQSAVLIACFCLHSNAGSAQYCIPTYNSNIGCQGFGDGKDINDFILWTTGTKHFIDTATGCAAYSHDDRTMKFPPIELIQGTTYNGIMSSHGSQTAMKIWIDFKDDGIFHPADSVTSPAITTLYSKRAYPYSIYIPANADTGVHRMRVRMSTSTSLNIDPCAMQTYGESHDYRVRIVPPPLNDVGVYKISDIKKTKFPHPDSIFCNGRPILFKVILKNYGSNPQSNFDVQLDYSGAATGTEVTRYTGTLPPRGQDTMTIEFTPPVAGDYSLTAYTVLTTDTYPRNDPTNKNISVDTAPEAMLSDTAVCIDKFPIVLDAGNTNCTYIWNSYSDARYIQAYAPGTYTVTITSNFDCITRDTANVGHYPLPLVAGINITGSGSSFIFNAGKPLHVKEFFWELGNGDTAHTDTVHYTYGAPGTYKVKLIVYNDCGTDTATFDIIVFTTDVNTTAIGARDVALYPNPARDIAYVHTIPGTSIDQLLIIDNNGRIVYDTKPDAFSAKHAINVAQIPAGNYVVVIRSSKGNVYKMLSVLD